jgi:hypothetical protein
MLRNLWMDERSQRHAYLFLRSGKEMDLIEMEVKRRINI